MKLAHSPPVPTAPRSLLIAVALSMAVHAALLLGFVRAHGVSSMATAASALQARVVLQSATASVEQATAPAADNIAAAANAVATPAPSTAKPVREEGVATVAAREAPAAPSVAPAKTGLTPAPAYHEAKGLDPPPRPLHDIDPEYPDSANLQEGTVVLRLLISSAGEVDEVAVVRSTPAGLFEASALAAFGKARFSPGYFLGIPVKSQIFIEVGYTPINRGGAVSGQNR